MIKLVVTEQAGNKEVILPTIGYAVKKGTPLYLSKEQYYAYDIQTGVRNGLLHVEKFEKESEGEMEARVEIKNISKKPLGIDEVELLKDEVKYVSYEAAESENMMRAQQQGLIEINYPREKNQSNKEESTSKKTSSKKTSSSKKASSKKKTSKKKSTKKTQSKKQSKKKSSTKKQIEKESENIDEQDENSKEIDPKAYEPQARMHAWDAQNQSVLDKNESQAKVQNQMNSQQAVSNASDQDQVQVGEVDFSDDNTDETESNTKSQHQQKQSKKISTNKKQASKKKSKSIKPNGRVKESPSAEDEGFVYGNEDQGLSFVDAEQEQERIQSRGFAGQNDEIE